MNKLKSEMRKVQSKDSVKTFRKFKTICNHLLNSHTLMMQIRSINLAYKIKNNQDTNIKKIYMTPIVMVQKINKFFKQFEQLIEEKQLRVQYDFSKFNSSGNSKTSRDSEYD